MLVTSEEILEIIFISSCSLLFEFVYLIRQSNECRW